MPKYLFTLCLILIYSFSYSQKRRFKYTQKIPLNYVVVDSYTIKNGDTLLLPKGSTIKEERVIEKGGSKKTYTGLSTITVQKEETFDKAKTYERRIYGKGNVYVKNDDYSKIFIDFWLTPETYISKGHKLEFYTNDKLVKTETVSTSHKKLPYYSVCRSTYEDLKTLPDTIKMIKNSIDSLEALLGAGTQQRNYQEAKLIYYKQKNGSSGVTPKYDNVFKRDLKRELIKNENRLNSIYKSSKNRDNLWAVYSKEKVIVKNLESGDSTTLYKKYPKNSYITLDNREYIKLNFSAWEMAALTVPFKYRPGLKEGEIDVPSQATADFNVSSYFGRTWGRLAYKNRASEKIKPEGQAFSTGVFFGFNVVGLDSAKTSLQGEKALMNEQTVFGLTTGVGAVYNIYDFDIGLFAGVDFGLGEAGRKWNYSGELWLGFGIGYNITMLGKSK